jgi:ElaB/YqjD/DUF883 family membrane-anchored ribosome-binding protein
MNAAPTRAPLAVALVALVASAAACQSMYYGALEKFGIEKREILVDRVQDGREAQAEAKEEFQSALAAFKAATGFAGAELEELYDELSAHHQDCSSRVERVRSEIASIEDVAEALFDEWSDELDQYQSAELRRQSEETLRDTERRYGELIAAMRRAESKMEPVLQAFGDRVLFLKHNLNAQAVASLSKNLAGVELDVQKLVAEMEASIAEADAFVAAMQGG